MFVLNLNNDIKRLWFSEILLILLWDRYVRNVKLFFYINYKNVLNNVCRKNYIFLIYGCYFLNWNIVDSTNESICQRFIFVWLIQFTFNLNYNGFLFFLILWSNFFDYLFFDSEL